MKINHIEAINMGANQQQIADCVLTLIENKDFNTEQEFSDMESALIGRACKLLGWASIPQTGGLVINWDTMSGKFSNLHDAIDACLDNQSNYSELKDRMAYVIGYLEDGDPETAESLQKLLDGEQPQ